MMTTTLNGTWTVKPVGKLKGELLKPLKRNSFSGQVPGDVYADLLDNELIPDPFYRDNENDLQWIGYQGFSYSRDFTLTADQLNQDTIELHCDGLDTLATVTVNGKKIAKTENMFRIWRWDVSMVVKKAKIPSPSPSIRLMNTWTKYNPSVPLHGGVLVVPLSKRATTVISVKNNVTSAGTGALNV